MLKYNNKFITSVYTRFGKDSDYIINDNNINIIGHRYYYFIFKGKHYCRFILNSHFGFIINKKLKDV